MSKRLISSVLIAFAVLLMAIAVLWRALPNYLAARIDAALLEQGVLAHSKVRDLSLSGALWDLRIETPIALRLPTLKLEWTLINFWRTLPFKLQSVDGSASGLGFEGAGTRLGIPRILLEGLYQDKKLQIAKLEVFAPLEAPLRGSLEVQPQDPKILGTWIVKLRAEAQALRGLGLPEFRLVEPAELLLVFRQGERSTVELAKGSSRLKLAWAPSKKAPLTLQANDILAKLEWSSSGIGPFEFSTRYQLSYPGLRSTGHARLMGASVTEFQVSISDRLQSKEFNWEDYRVRGGSIRSEFKASVRSKILESLEGSVQAGIVEWARKQGVAQDTSLKLPFKCRGIDLGREIAAQWLRSCAIDKPGISLVIGKIFTKQPFRNVQLRLGPDQKKYVGKISAIWQGSMLESDLFEVASDFSRVDLSIADKKLSLHELLVALDSPKLSGSGMVLASLKLSWVQDKGLTIDPAFFQSKGKGIIRYIADPALSDSGGDVKTVQEFQALLAKGQQALVFKALEDFHYNDLKILMRRTPELLTRAEVKLAGSNPGLLKGQPFEFNIPIEGDLESLLVNSFMKDFSQRAKP